MTAWVTVLATPLLAAWRNVSGDAPRRDGWLKSDLERPRASDARGSRSACARTWSSSSPVRHAPPPAPAPGCNKSVSDLERTCSGCTCRHASSSPLARPARNWGFDIEKPADCSDCTCGHASSSPLARPARNCGSDIEKPADCARQASRMLLSSSSNLAIPCRSARASSRRQLPW